MEKYSDFLNKYNDYVLNTNKEIQDTIVKIGNKKDYLNYLENFLQMLEDKKINRRKFLTIQSVATLLTFLGILVFVGGEFVLGNILYCVLVSFLAGFFANMYFYRSRDFAKGLCRDYEYENPDKSLKYLSKEEALKLIPVIKYDIDNFTERLNRLQEEVSPYNEAIALIEGINKSLALESKLEQNTSYKDFIAKENADNADKVKICEGTLNEIYNEKTSPVSIDYTQGIERVKLTLERK